MNLVWTALFGAMAGSLLMISISTAKIHNAIKSPPVQTDDYLLTMDAFRARIARIEKGCACARPKVVE